MKKRYMMKKQSFLIRQKGIPENVKLAYQNFLDRHYGNADKFPTFQSMYDDLCEIEDDTDVETYYSIKPLMDIIYNEEDVKICYERNL